MHFFGSYLQRIHKFVPQAGELVFVDSSGGFDSDGYRVFLFMTHSACGGESTRMECMMLVNAV